MASSYIKIDTHKQSKKTMTEQDVDRDEDSSTSTREFFEDLL